MPAPDYDYRKSSVEEDRRRANEVWERVERRKRDSRPASQGEGASGNGADGSADGQHDSKQDSAARSIQSRYRQHVDQRTANGCNMSSSKRWKDGMKQRQMSEAGHDLKDGLLVWAKDGQPLDTSKYHEDRGPDKGGIVAISEEEYQENRRKENEKLKKLAEAGQGDISSSDYDSSSSSSSSDEADEVREGVRAYGDKGGTAGHGKGVRQAKEVLAFWDRWFCHSGKRRWLYVSDLQNNLYVGIKKTGSFQHSSFLYGARCTSSHSSAHSKTSTSTCRKSRSQNPFSRSAESRSTASSRRRRRTSRSGSRRAC
ncbi:hypothetical protein AAT19DRAFT_16090 [Rhodotorula toruloides]|uniref:Uncharacterized protein n=1 Tax=Rhodotorula toruloides TaxID=5286 RepID=A0A2T0A5P8_RHOTO|nr:hypothetical protein AAT19DRAFT_16090 [Rhodotorula toruloides]